MTALVEAANGWGSPGEMASVLSGASSGEEGGEESIAHRDGDEDGEDDGEYNNDDMEEEKGVARRTT